MAIRSRLMRVALTLWLTALFSSLPLSAAQQAWSFEVASIKLSGPLDSQKMMSGQQRYGIKVDAGRADIESLSLSDLIDLAFQVKPHQVTGPLWLDVANTMTAERFDIHARIPRGTPPGHVLDMLQTLLAERFKLAFHRERKDQPIFALIVGKNGATLHASAPDSAAPANASAGSGSVRPDAVQVSGNAQSGMTVTGGGAAGATRVTMSPDGAMHLEAEKMTLGQLADTLTRFVGRPVVDMTGLTGFYRIVLDLSREDLNTAARAVGVTPAGAAGAGFGAGDGPASAPDPSGTSVFQSVEQLGLTLDARTSPVEQIVIDHLERTPTED